MNQKHQIRKLSVRSVALTVKSPAPIVFLRHDDEGLRMLSLLSVVLLHRDREAVCGQE
jgi:hypothetical protein